VLQQGYPGATPFAFRFISRQIFQQQPTQPRPRRPVARPFYKRWWFWTIVGAVVAGGAVTAGVIAGQSGSASGPPIYDWSSFR
ncbi:MAG: hypothetical protein KC503_19770, partial [Myxococcales bacterium]|nr:hypothetical protein [Myxococcales bacterium]